MAYCELRGAIRHHYKTNRLMAALKVSRREAVGIICTLSSWAIDNRPGGIIESALIPDAIEWDGDRKALLAALLDKQAVTDGLSGWLDDLGSGRVKIHDWEDVTRGYIKAQKDAATRTEALRRARGELPKEDVQKPPIDRSSTPEAQAADAYMRANPTLMKRSTVTAEIRVARKAGAPMEKIMELCSSEALAKDVKIWDLLKPITPKYGRETGAIEAADKLRQEFDDRDKKLKQEHATKAKGEAVL